MINERYHKIGFGLVGISLCALPFSKALSSVAMLLFALWWLWGFNYNNKIKAIINNKLAIGLIAYFIIVATGYFFTTNKLLVQTIIQHKSICMLAGIAMPFMLVTWHSIEVLFNWLVGVITLTSAYCLGVAVYRFSQLHNADVFFYHTLLSPLNLHAVYFSINVYLCLIFLVQQLFYSSSKYKWLYIIAFAWLNVILLLLSSKLILIVYALSVIAYITVVFRKSIWLVLTGSAILVIMAFVLFTSNNVSKRFNDLSLNVNDALHKDKYGDNVYLDGLNFRLLTIRLGTEIVSENKAWLFGVSSGDAQRLLTNKMREAKLYKGYYEYNFHNQFIETYVQCGLIGLVCLLFIFGLLIYYAFKLKYLLFSAFVMVFVAFAFTESFLERQYGTFPFVLLSFIFIKLAITYSTSSGTSSNSY